MNDLELDEILDCWQAPPVLPALRVRVREGFAQRRAPRRWRWFGTFALAAGLAAVGAGLLVDRPAGGEIGRWDDSTWLRRTYVVSPAGDQMNWAVVGRRTTGIRHRDGTIGGSHYLVKEPEHVYYGYTWSAQLQGRGQYRFALGPLDAAVTQKNPGRIAPHAADSRLVSAGSAFDVEIYAQNGQRVYDHYELFSKPVPFAAPPMTPEQAARQITLTDPQVFLDGAPLGGNSASGPGITLDVPHAGRFLLAMAPHSNPLRARAGTVRGNSLEFHAAGHEIRIECSAPIATGGERPLYVHEEPDPAVKTLQIGAKGLR